MTLPNYYFVGDITKEMMSRLSMGKLLSTSMRVLLAATTYALLESSFLAGCGDEASVA
ncbi:unnamed protein product [Brassica oleracea]